MRRSSIVGPLLLIGIGSLFLARNVWPELPLLDYLARYWPWLLILWGGLRLAEILVWTGKDRPLPSRGVSGPEWTLVIFLCFIGVSLHAVRGFTDWLPRSGINMGGLEMFGESYDYPVAAEQQTSKAPRVILSGFRGNARVVGTDAMVVKVSGHNTVRSLDRVGADRANTEAALNITGDANQVTIRTNQDRVSGGQRVSADLEISVPKGATIEAHGRGGDFDFTGIDGNIEVEAARTGVRLENVAGDVRIDVRESDVIRATNLKGGLELKGRGSDIDFENIAGQVTINGNFSGVTQIRNIQKPVRYVTPWTEFAVGSLPGQVRLTLGDLNATNMKGPVRMTSSRSWDVQLSDFTESLEMNLQGGDIDLRPGAVAVPKMDVRTRSGNIELGLPASAKFDLTASSSRGDVVNDYGAPIDTQAERRGGTLRGANGGAAINLRTERGQVLIRKASVGEGPLQPRGKLRPPEFVEAPDLPKPPSPPKPGTIPEPPRPLNQ